MEFNDLRAEILDLRRQMQEVQSTAYAILPVSDGYQFITYLDVETATMGYTVVDDQMLEIKLLSDMPAQVLVQYGQFVDAIERWQSGDIKEFPFADHLTANIATLRSPFQFVPPDEDLHGDEGKIE